MVRYVKLFVALVVVVFVSYTLILIYSQHSASPSPALAPELTPAPPLYRLPKDKYILLWGKRESPFNLIKDGVASFKNNNCKHLNCYVTDNETLLNDVTLFDAIVFNGKRYTKWVTPPARRSDHQKYIFAGTESSHNFPVCDTRADGFFNWTWTYKLDSDIKWRYLTIYNMNDQEIGPKKDMKWVNMDPISDELKMKLNGKTKGAAWFVSHCATAGKREKFFQELNELQEYAWSIDVFGACGNMTCPRAAKDTCPRAAKDVCPRMVQEDYHFYLAFENSFSEDYVTEKVLTALQNYAIPVVFGSANYSRFLPPGSYLNARELGPKKLLQEMDCIYNDRESFYDFFRWTNHYKYKQAINSLDLCNLCAALSDEDKVRKKTVVSNLTRWWSESYCKKS